MTAPEFPCPTCPMCGQPPEFVIGPTQAVCGNRGGCNLIMWDPSVSLDENLMDAETVRLHGETGKGA